MRIVYLLTSCRSSLVNLVFFFLPVILIDRGIDAVSRGALMAMVSVTGVLFSFVAGMLADRLSPRPVIAAGLVLTSLFLAVLGLADRPLVLVFGFAALGIANHLHMVGSEAYLHKEAPAESRTASLSALITANTVAMAIGLAVGGQLLTRVASHRIALVAAVGCALLAALVGLLRAMPAAPVAAQSYHADLRHRHVLALLAFCFVTRVHWGVEMTCYSPFLERGLGLDRAQAGLFMAGPIAMLGVTALFAGRALDGSRSASWALGGGAFVAGIGHFAFALTTSIPWSLAFRIVHEVGEAVLLAGVYREVAHTATRERSGGMFGAVALVGSLAAAVGALVASPFGESYGFALMNQLGGLSMIVALPLLVAIYAPRPEPAPALL